MSSLTTPAPTASGTPTAATSITLAGGCFWCLDAVYRRIRGVQSVQCIYCNGQLERPDYEQVCRGDSGHVEAVRIAYDPAQIGLADLLEIFFQIHDPTTLNRQGYDVGTQYRSGIYVTDESQHRVALEVMARIQREHWFGAPLTTELLPLQNDWPAEPYHQDYFAQNPGQGYCVAVIRPKLAKASQSLAQWLRP